MRRASIVLVSLALSWLISPGVADRAAAQQPPQEKRIALVVGDGNYEKAPLATAANDAGLIAQTLQAAGFDVIGARDLDADGLRNSFHDFMDKVQADPANTVAMIYLSGYGIQLAGENYFIPVDAKISRDTDIPIEGLRISDYTRQLASIPVKASIVVLDAARAQPFIEGGNPIAGGLALVDPAPNMLIARALAESQTLGTLHDMEVSLSVHMPWELWSFLSKAPRLEITYHSIHYIDLVRSFFGNPHSVYAKSVRSPRTPDLASTKSVITFDYGDDKRVFIATNHSHDFSPRLQRSFVQWEGMTGAMRAQMGVNLNYPVGEPDDLQYILRGDKDWSKAPVNGNWFPDAFMGSMGSLQAYVEGTTKSLPTSVEDAIDTMRVVEAAYRSSEQGGVALLTE